MITRFEFKFASMALLMLLAQAGCSMPHATVELFHPFEFGPQQTVKLDSEWAHYGCDEGETVARLICEWPLPGSRYGAKQYVMYLQLPAATGVFDVGSPIAPGAASAIFSDSAPASAAEGRDVVSGFLIQKTGRLRGVTHFVEGRIEIKGGGLLRGTIDLVCADQTEIFGRFVARPGFEMSFFEREHQLDIANAQRVAQGESLPDPAVEP